MVSCVFLSQNLYAQTNSAPLNTSTRSLDIPWKSLFKKMRVAYKSMIGVSAQTEDESEFEGKIDYDEAMSSQMMNELAVGYQVNAAMVASLVGVWSLRSSAEKGQRFEPLDPYLKLAFDDLYENGNFGFSTDLRIGAPMSRESKEAERIVAIGSEQEIEYQFGKSPVSFEMEIFFQYNVHKNYTDTKDVEVRYEPAFLYGFNDKFYGRLAYESHMHHERHGSLALIDNREPTIQSGFGWQPNSKLNLYPFMDLNLTEPGTKNALYGVQLNLVML